MGDDQCGAPFGGRINCLLDFVFGGAIDGTGRIIQNQDAWIRQEGARQSQALTLPPREGDTTLTDNGFITIFEV